MKSFKRLNFDTSVSSVHLVQLNLLSCHLLGKELLTRLVIFLFDVLDKLWVLIRSVPEVPLLILFGPYQVYLNNTALRVGYFFLFWRIKAYRKYFNTLKSFTVGCFVVDGGRRCI